MAMSVKDCDREGVSYCGLWTDAAGLRRRSAAQISKHWLRHPCAVLFIYALCARLPSAEACQREHLPNYCFWEHEDEYQSCPIPPSERVGCIYAMINSTEELLSVDGNSVKFPSQPRSFAIKSYTSHFRSVRECGHVFNITWQLPHDGSFEYLEGFLLNITFAHKDEPQRFLRHFKVETRELGVKDLQQVVFHYECFVPRPNTLFQIRLQSLPIAPLDMTNHETQSLQTHANEVDVDPNNTGNWKASIWFRSIEASSSAIEVCFTTAPVDFRFARYNVYLVSFSSQALRLIRYAAAVEVDQTENAADACHTFTDICSDMYRIEVEPESDGGTDCKCRLGSKCVAFCAVSVLERADMTNDKLRCPPSTMPSKNQTSTSTTEIPILSPTGRITGVVVGSFLGLVVLGLLGFLVWKRRRPPDQKQVFILGSSETSILQEFVGLLGDFLRKRSGCQVHILSDWLRPDADSNLDRLWSEVVNADCTIFVMSDACRRRYHDAMKGVIKPPGRRGSVINNAVVAMMMRITWSNDCEAVRRKCLEVCPPDDEGCHDLDKAVQRSYRLPEEIADLVWDVRGVKKPRFYFLKMWKLVERRKVMRDWEQNAFVQNDRKDSRGKRNAQFRKEASVLLETPARQTSATDDGEYSSRNNNRESFADLNEDILETGGQMVSLKREVSKNDSGFSGSVLSGIAEMMSFKPPLSLTQSSSTLNASVGPGGVDSILFNSSFDCSNTSIHDGDEDWSASGHDFPQQEECIIAMYT